ncbi:MAG TPA: hypothetical protein VJP79_03945 [Nitrososphaera sp.]|nr:hypothetical protein [Nitrososphaera sp.]
MDSKKPSGAKSKTSASGKVSKDQAEQGRKPRKVTITLALEHTIIGEVRKEAADLKQSVNTRINHILRKHVRFYRMTESHCAAVMHPALVQFIIDEIDESKFIEHWNSHGIKMVQGYFNMKGLPFTFDNFVDHYLGELAVDSGVVRAVRRYVDEQDSRKCLFLLHAYNAKWSRIIGSVYSHQIEDLLDVHTMISVLPDGVEIKLVEKDMV